MIEQADPLIQGRAGNRDRSWRLRPVAPGRGPRWAPPACCAARTARPARDRSGHRRRSDRTHPGLDRRLEARHPDQIRNGAARLHSRKTSRSCGASCSIRTAHKCSCLRWTRPPGSTSSRPRGSARRTRPTRSRSLSRTTSHPRWDCGAPRRRRRPSARIRMSSRSPGAPRATTSSRCCPSSPGGREARDAIQGWLDQYGMRGASRIDITRPALERTPIHAPAPDPRPHRALRARRRRIRRLPTGAAGGPGQGAGAAGAIAGSAGRKAAGRGGEVGDRPGPHLHRLPAVSEDGMVSRYFVYKQALLREADRLVQAGVLSRTGGHLLPQVRGDPGRRPHAAGRRPAHR